MKPLHDASLAQIIAAKPNLSTWLSANAGSGKTKVLTDRVARLLLNKVEPQHILCLTYTKAAATEMQNRLFRRLGEWAMKPDAELRSALVDLGEGDEISQSQLALARQLFARAIETPGGLRIQTIHSFCATLLRRYPLEAGVTPGFKEMDDRTAKALRDEIVQDMADRLAPEAVAMLARHYSGEDFIALLAEICTRADDFAAPFNRQEALARFNLPEGFGWRQLIDGVFLGDEADILAELRLKLAGGSATDKKNAAKLAVLEPFSADLRTISELEKVFLVGSGERAGLANIGKFPTKDTRAALGDMILRVENFMQRIESVRVLRIGLSAVEKAVALHEFAQPFLAEYTARKQARGYLDFDDLIRKAAGLLNDPGLAAWVLFRLDGGIDHILVDEAQDTSPRQWAVIEKLAAEFTAGDSARDVPRTLFVVGDKKQSIYSFQGADLSAFDAKRMEFRDRFAAVEQPMQDRTLDYSFRSSKAVLDLVDRTFGDEFPQALGDPPRHLAFFESLPGRVDLWPLVPKAEAVKDEDGWSPVDLVSDSHHTVELARQIAEEIKEMLATGTQIPERGGARPMRAGDILILVQSRGPMFSQIIRACKQAGLPIAGADRLKLGEEMAVKDLSALLSFLATPEDDLSLAAALRSPLFGWSEDRLYRMAHGRKGFLWENLRNSAETETVSVLQDLRNMSDFRRPYEILERILTHHRGRQHLLTRLGAEAEDGIDELLNQALAYEQTDVPSLTGFLIWLQGDVVEVKRQADSEGDNIRVMTVHGSKGLEAPVVILPDTADRKPRDYDDLLRLPDGTPVWNGSAGDSPADVQAVQSERKAKQAQENLRLLYVALTRARSWLIVAGAGEAKTEDSKGAKARVDWSWYRQVEAGLRAVAAQPFGTNRLRHQYGDWPEATGTPSLPAAKAALTWPEWMERAAPDVPRDPGPLRPSGLGGAKALPGEGDEPEVAMARGTALHLLLEHLPKTDPVEWVRLAQVATPENMDPQALLDEALEVLAMPEAEWLFAEDTLAEVSITADLDGRQIAGALDRVVIYPDRILAVDFKSNRVTPASPAQVPDGVLRQMGAYAHALAQIYPNHQIETAILWTASALFMPLPPELVHNALQTVRLP